MPLPRFRGTITYRDGTTVEYSAGAVALADWEEYALRHNYPIGNANGAGVAGMLAMLVIAHAALGVDEGFEVWRRSVENIDFADTEEISPTRPGP